MTRETTTHDDGGVTIRPATAADRTALIELLQAQLDEHEIAIDEGGVARAEDGFLLDPRLGTLLVAARGEDAPVGVACLAFSWTLERGGMVAWLDELYVLPTHRCHGIGTRLLRAAQEHARERGCMAMDLEVEESHGRAAHLYQREGFTPLPRQHWKKPLDDTSA